MTALEELRSGRLGEGFARLLYRQMLVVGRRYHFPPPQGHVSWDLPAAVELVHEYLADSGNYPRLVELAATVSDEASLQRTVAVVMRNHLRSLGRRTVLGKLMRRLNTLLSEDSRFVALPGRRFALIGASLEPYNGEFERLRSAARAVGGVTVVRWSPEARREGPVADASTLLALSTAVLEAAGSALPLLELAEVVAVRIGLDLRGVAGLLPIDDVDVLATDRGPSAAAASSPEAAVSVLGRSIEDDEVARAVLAEFSDREKLVLAWLHLSVRDVAKETGLAVSTAGSVSQRVRDKLSSRLAGIDVASAERIAIAVRDGARAQLRLEPM